MKMMVIKTSLKILLLIQLGCDKSSLYNDLDQDGDIDILTCSANSSDLSTSGMKWLKNNGSESFTTINIKTGIQAFDIHAADMNNDGDIDILVSMNDYTNSSYIWIYENSSSESFSKSATITVSTKNEKLVYPYDLDQDGDLDIIASNSENGTFWLENLLDDGWGAVSNNKISSSIE